MPTNQSFIAGSADDTRDNIAVGEPNPQGDDTATTLAIGEEDGATPDQTGLSPLGDDQITTFALGEEDGAAPPPGVIIGGTTGDDAVTTLATGEEDGDVTTLALGEEDSSLHSDVGAHITALDIANAGGEIYHTMDIHLTIEETYTMAQPDDIS